MKYFFHPLTTPLFPYRRKRALTLGVCTFILLAALMPGCASETTDTPPPQQSDDTAGRGVAFIVTTDYITGSFSTISLEDFTPHNDLGSIHGDASAKFTGDQLFILNRLSQDNIQILDWEGQYTTTANHSVGTGTNPGDLVLIDQQTALIARYQAASLLFMDVTSGDHLDELDLSSVADGDGFPEPNAMLAREDGKVVVTCQRLDQDNWFSPTDYSSLVLIDPEEKQILKETHLTFTNPVTTIVKDPITGDLLIGGLGHYGALDGGVERIDQQTLQPKEVVITEEELGGDLLAMAMDSTGRLYLLVQDDSFLSRMVAINTGGNTDGPPHTIEELTEGGLNLTSLAIDTMDRIWVTDRDPVNPGVRIFEQGGQEELTEKPIDTGLPPFGIIFIAPGHSPDTGE